MEKTKPNTYYLIATVILGLTVLCWIIGLIIMILFEMEVYPRLAESLTNPNYWVSSSSMYSSSSISSASSSIDPYEQQIMSVSLWIALFLILLPCLIGLGCSLTYFIIILNYTIKGKKASLTMKIFTLILGNFISGIILLCDPEAKQAQGSNH